MFVDIYAIQSVPPSNINRDDTGSPKTALYGGVLRARVSSQAWKRAMRETFKKSIDAGQLGVRTKNAVSLIGDAIIKKKPELVEKAEELAVQMLKATGMKTKESDRAGEDKGQQATEYLVFIANKEIDKLADLAVESEEKQYSESALKKKVNEAFQGSQAIDIALFGRMLADAPELNTDAAAQVAHAISVNQITPEYDYFTAVDECASSDNAGAAMLDTVGFNSSTLYRYATVNIDSLHEQLQDKEATVRAVSAFVDAFLRSMPTGKQNTFANRTLPESCVVVIRDSQPINVPQAFEQPIKQSSDASISRQATAALAKQLAQVQQMYGEQPVAAWNAVMDEPVSDFDGWSERVNIPELEEQLSEKLDELIAD